MHIPHICFYGFCLLLFSHRTQQYWAPHSWSLFMHGYSCAEKMEQENILHYGGLFLPSYPTVVDHLFLSLIWNQMLLSFRRSLFYEVIFFFLTMVVFINVWCLYSSSSIIGSSCMEYTLQLYQVKQLKEFETDYRQRNRLSWERFCWTEVNKAYLISVQLTYAEKWKHLLTQTIRRKLLTWIFE